VARLREFAAFVAAVQRCGVKLDLNALPSAVKGFVNAD
jgi:hypothetical protein